MRENFIASDFEIERELQESTLFPDKFKVSSWKALYACPKCEEKIELSVGITEFCQCPLSWTMIGNNRMIVSDEENVLLGQRNKRKKRK